MMLCMTHVISFYDGKSHINGPKKLGTMMPCMTCYFISLWKIPHKWPKKDRYHYAVNHTCDTSLVKCLQSFATELDAIMCLMSKTECKSFCV